MPSKPYKPMLLKRLADPEYAMGYLTEVLEHESQEAFLIAIKNVIDARDENLSQLADEIGISRQGLYKMLSEDGNPRLSTLSQLLKSLGMKIKITGDVAA
ncbi:MAG: putative addiction module antidote protein [Bdellovibrionales bacterium]|nr:putative addiction module antidote protein [Bdellovibrionales bacterium]